MKTVIPPFKMILRNIAPLLILVIIVSRGHALPCHRTEYQMGNECCPLCPAGNRVVKDCTEFRSTSCKPCLNETFMNHPTGLKHCFPCAKCDAGFGLKIKRSCTDTSDTSCESLEGFYCMDSTEDGCVAAKKHTRCQPGQYISQNGTALRDTRCSDCSAGTFSNGTLFVCQPHTQCESMNLIKPGNPSTDAECREQSSHESRMIFGIGVSMVIFMIGMISTIMWYVIKKKKNGGPSYGKRKDNTKRNDGEILAMNSTDNPTADTEPKILTAPMVESQPAAVHPKHIEACLLPS